MTIATQPLTLETFAALYEGRPYELIAGVPTPMYYDEFGKVCEVSPTGGKHQMMVVEIAYYLREYARKQRPGLVLAGEGGMIIDHSPDTVRTFDAAYIAQENLPETGIPTEYWEKPLDLVVEVISPGNRAGEMRAKVADYLHAGVKMVWIIYPDGYLVDVYRPDQPTLTMQRGDILEGGDVLPEFRLKIEDLFAPLAALEK